LAFHEEQYRPSNTVLSVVGDVDAETIHAQVEELLGMVPRGELRRHRAPDEPAPSALRFDREVGSYAPNLVMVGFPLSVASASDLRALQVLGEILVDASSSRLNMPLKVERDLLEDASSRIVLNEGTGLFEVLIQAPTKADDQALRKLFTELDRIRRFGVLDKELAAARMGLENRWWSQREGVLSDARIQAAEAGPRARRSSPQAWDAVSSKDVQEAITRWLQIPRASIVELLNENTSRARPYYMRLDAATMQEHLQGAVLAAAQHERAPIAPSPPPSNHSRLALGGWSGAFELPMNSDGGIHRYKFDNGAVLIVDSTVDTPMCSVSLRFRGGHVAEVRNTAGLTGLLQDIMIEQTATRDRVSLAVELAGLGTNVVPLRGLDSFGFRMNVQGADLPYAFDILYDMTTNPGLDARRFLKAVNDHGRDLRRVSSRLFHSTSELVREAAWGENGYGVPDLGTLDALKALNPGRLQEFYSESCNPGNAVIVVTGKLDPEEVRSFVEPYMSAWSDSSDLYPTGAQAYFNSDLIGSLPEVETGRTKEVHRPDPLAALQIGFSAPGLRDPLSSSYRVFSAWMKGPESPLRSALSAGGYSGPLYLHNQGGALGSLFCLYTVSPSTQLESAQKDVLEAARAAADAPLGEEQLSRIKSYLETSFLLKKQTLDERDAFLARREIWGLSLENLSDHVADFSAVSLDSVRALSGKILRGPYAVGRVNGTASEK
jgi:zinc protease